MQRIMIHGACHTGKVWERLVTALAERGIGGWHTPSLSDYAPIPSFEQGAALIEAAYPGPKVVISHSMGALTAMRLALMGNVRAVICVAPVGKGIWSLVRSYARLMRITGTASLKFDPAHGRTFPIEHPGMAQFFYNPAWPAAERERLRGQLVAEPYHVSPTDFLRAIPGQPCPPLAAEVISYTQDKATTPQSGASVAKWLHCGRVQLLGCHNEFESEAGAARLAGEVAHFMRRYRLLSEEPRESLYQQVAVLGQGWRT